MNGDVWAIAMVKDEADVIEATVRNMAAQCDGVIVADNGSTDGTFDILERLSCEFDHVVIVADDEPAYMQSDKMTALADLARNAFDAAWVVPFDADEIWYANGGATIAERLADTGPSLGCAAAELWDHVATGLDSTDPNPVRRIGWRRPSKLPLPKVACRARPNLRIHQGNHGCDFGGITPASEALLVVRHFPYRSVEQFVRKVRNGAAAYRAAGDRLPATAGAHWRQWGNILDAHGEDAVADIFRTWFWRADPRVDFVVGDERQGPLLFDPAPAHGQVP